MHDQTVQHVLRAPLAFFHTNPTGRILNRFSKDQGTADDHLPQVAFDATQSLFLVAGKPSPFSCAHSMLTERQYPYKRKAHDDHPPRVALWYHTSVSSSDCPSVTVISVVIVMAYTLTGVLQDCFGKPAHLIISICARHPTFNVDRP